ncbi:DUF4340 domain-containing protein [Neorhodopirellula pilleata]|uniref:DUF4340 domain-containing protein n=1 Tax=Neorhodopirellula pilleata TaxID=2714738 RepID=A0A5C6AB11_9BACT|nr:DUF4340 domain-containing protein [Neorhodopirellula pilleata]TWT96241.1 hypothetical protein Pla100_27170 [Neorhodopirellula pilleata]
MNEGQKTGLFCIVGLLTLAVGLFLSWPNAERLETSVTPGKPLFENFKDPLAAASLKMVTFDEEQGQVDTFEVRRDRDTGVWTIPSRKGYPADAVEQMKDAANALVGLQILDVQTRNAEDHEALGVVEPKLEALEVGDVGVGRLVTFRDEAQKDLASLIIGNPVKDEEGKIYVRKPGQDPVYVVKLEEAALSTRFQDWIEEDLLQLSSIDISKMTIKDYAASMTQRGIALTRNYTAEIKADGSNWSLGKLLEYPADNPLADPKVVDVEPTQTLNTEKLNDIKNALDDLKIVDVVRKPEGMSDNLRADKDLISDNEAVSSLASRGFFPVSTGDGGEFEVLSANGELNVSVNDGVQYVLRFGNVSGLTEDDDKSADEAEGESESGTGVNRYLLVTTRVDEEQFPAPELAPVPQTIEELAAMLGVEAKPQPKDEPAKESPESQPEMKEAEKPADSTDANQDKKSETAAEEMKTESDAKTDEPKTDESAKADTDKPAEVKEPADKKSDSAKEQDTKPETKEKPAAVEEVEVSGSGEATGEGQGADDGDAGDDKPADETPAENDAAEVKSDTESGEPAAMENAAKKKDGAEEELSFAELSDDEKQERLEAEQEKILKENTRKLDERKDRLNAAQRRVRDLNARFADWYYVIPENTYRELRIQRDELLTAAEPIKLDGSNPGTANPDGLNGPE